MFIVSRPKPPWQTLAMTRHKSHMASLVIRVEPECIAARPKGTRTWFRLPWGIVYQMAVRAEVEAMRRAKAAKRKGSAK